MVVCSKNIKKRRKKREEVRRRVSFYIFGGIVSA